MNVPYGPRLGAVKFALIMVGIKEILSSLRWLATLYKLL